MLVAPVPVPPDNPAGATPGTTAGNKKRGKRLAAARPLPSAPRRYLHFYGVCRRFLKLSAVSVRDARLRPRRGRENHRAARNSASQMAQRCRRVHAIDATRTTNPQNRGRTELKRGTLVHMVERPRRSRALVGCFERVLAVENGPQSLSLTAANETTIPHFFTTASETLSVG